MKNEFKLSDDQDEAIELIKRFVNEKSTDAFLLQGHAGTGKTTILKIVIDHLIKNRMNFCLCAPTHRAKNVLEKRTGCSATTLHKLLSMKPNINIFDLDLSLLKFKSNGLTMFPNNGIVICDESSMINDELYSLLSDYSKLTNSKLLFVGDKAQLQAVGDRDISKVFNIKRQYSLSKIHRQNEDNDIFEVLDILRSEPINNWGPYSNLKSIEYYNRPKEFLDDLTLDVEKMISIGDVNHTKLLAYRNVVVQGMNKYIRKSLFKDTDNINVGEILTGYSNYKFNDYEFFNSSDYIVKEVKYETRLLPHTDIKVPGWNLRVLDTGYNVLADLYILDHNKTSNEDMLNIASSIEVNRLGAVRYSRMGRKRMSSRYWRCYYDLIESFACMIDLFYEKRIVKSKTFDFGYCSTVHKVQGVTLDNVYIDMSDVNKCLDVDQLRQLQYVGLSRTSNSVKMYL